MNKKEKVGTLFLSTSLLSVSAQALIQNAASAVSIKEVLSKTTAQKNESMWSIFTSMDKFGEAVQSGSALASGALGILASAFTLGTFKIFGIDKIARSFGVVVSPTFHLAVGTAAGVIAGKALSYLDFKNHLIGSISPADLNELKLRIENFIGKKTNSENVQKIYIDKKDDYLTIGIETDGNAISHLYGPTLKIGVSSSKASVTFQENGIDSKEEEITNYTELSQKLGLILHKIDKKLWAFFLDRRKERKRIREFLSDIKLSDIKITDNASPYVDGHPLRRFIEFLRKHNSIMCNTMHVLDFDNNSIKLIKIDKCIGYDAKLSDDVIGRFGKHCSEGSFISILNETLATKNLKDDYRLKIREDNVGNYKLALYKGEPSENTYIGDIEDEEDVEILKDLELPKAKKYVLYKEQRGSDIKVLFLDETSHVDSNGKPESRLYFITDYDGTREYVFEPEDIKDDEDAQKIRKTIINTIKRKYEK